VPDFAAYVWGRERVGYRLPQGFDLTDVEGLRAVQILRENDDVILAAFDDPATATLRAAEVASVLAFSDPPRVLVVADGRRAKGPWWPASVLARAERIVAIGGIVLALVSYGNLLFAAPDYTLRAPETQNVLAGAPAEFAVSVFNRGDEPARITVDTSSPVTITPPMFTLESRKDQVLTVRTSNSVVNETVVKLEAHGRAGRLRGTLSAPASVRLVPWPPIERQALQLARVYQDGTAAEVRAPFRIGQAADGLTCSGTLLLAPGVTIEAARPSDRIGQQDVNRQPGNELAYLTWTMNAVDAFSSVDVLVYLESETPKSQPEWNVLLEKLQIECKGRPHE
jgi:hypothetical protein